MGIAWSELISADTTASRDFYTTLLGWTTSEMPMPDGGVYTLFHDKGEPCAGLMAPPDDGMPAPLWFTYVAVEDADASAARARELGATIIQEPFDIGGAGRIGIVRDPAGATVGLYQAAG